MDISQERLDYLEKIEQKMYALEEWGLKDWEYYEDALKHILAQEERDKKIKDTVREITHDTVLNLYGDDIVHYTTDIIQNHLSKMYKKVKELIDDITSDMI